jgi:hypothetical protein
MIYMIIIYIYIYLYNNYILYTIDMEYGEISLKTAFFDVCKGSFGES